MENSDKPNIYVSWCLLDCEDLYAGLKLDVTI